MKEPASAVPMSTASVFIPMRRLIPIWWKCCEKRRQGDGAAGGYDFQHFVGRIDFLVPDDFAYRRMDFLYAPG